MFAGAVDATFAAFGIDAIYKAVGGGAGDREARIASCGPWIYGRHELG